jgi:hypothetical protein
MRDQLRVIVVAMLLCLGARVPACIAQETRTITVRLHIDVPEGLTLPADYRPELCTAVPVTPVRYFSFSRGLNEGDFTVSAEVPTSTTKVYVLLREVFSADTELAAPPEVPEKRRLKGFWEFTKTLWTLEQLAIPIEPGIGEYSRSVTAERAVNIRGVFVNEQGKRLGPFICRQEHSNRMMTTRATPAGFAFLGVRANHPTWIAYGFDGDDGAECLIRYVTAEELAADLVLGEVTVPPSGVDARADILVTNNDALPMGPAGGGTEIQQQSPGLPFLCAISEDGSRLTLFDLVDSRTRHKLNDAGANELGYLKAGPRFLVPGLPNVSLHVEKVLRLLRAGRANDLIAAGVPRISPAPGDTVTMTIDALDVVNRINAIPE